jgi:hypothetical protein
MAGAVAPAQGGSDGTWGTEILDFLDAFADIATGDLRILCYEGDVLTWENDVVCDVSYTNR